MIIDIKQAIAIKIKHFEIIVSNSHNIFVNSPQVRKLAVDGFGFVIVASRQKYLQTVVLSILILPEYPVRILLRWYQAPSS